MKNRLLDFLASYGFACILLLFLFVLTLLGTLEQTQHGLYEVQRKYFESLFLVHWLFGAIPLPLPGVYLVLLLLALNLVLGGLVRIRKSTATVGVIVIHVGILVMLLAGFVKLKLSTDGHLTLFPQQASDEFESYFEWEVAIWDASQTRDARELVVPEEDFSDLSGERARTFDSAELPFRLTLSRFEKNALVLPKGPMWSSPYPTIDGYAVKPEAPSKEAEHNIASLFLKAVDKGGGPAREGILWGVESFPFVFNSGGKSWAVDLRHRRFRMPFEVRLDRFTHEVYPGTTIDKVFKSDVTVRDPDDRVEQNVKIEMNQPLRYRGLVLFQASWGPPDAKPGEPLFSTFAVVRNPSDQWPLISCIIIALGMIAAFTLKLAKYTWAQARARRA